MLGKLAANFILRLHKTIEVSGGPGIEAFLELPAVTLLCLVSAAMAMGFTGAKVSSRLSSRTEFQDVLLSIMPLRIRGFCGGRSTQSAKLT